MGESLGPISEVVCDFCPVYEIVRYGITFLEMPSASHGLHNID
jgi:hypothetical protein